MTISGNINHTGANTFSTGTGNISLNGNIIVNPTKSLTSGVISCSSINNSGTLSTGVIEIYNASFPYIDMKSVISDYDIRFGCTSGSSGTSGQGTLTINAANTIISSPLTANSGTFSGITNNTNVLTNNSTLSQVGLANFSNDIKVNIGQSVYIINSGLTNFLRMHHSGVGGAAYIDYTGELNFRNSTTSSVSPTNTCNINFFEKI